jgi:chromosome segregation ATPase
VEELREIVRELKRERKDRAQAAARLKELEQELLRVQQAAARAEEERATLRDALGSTEQLLETVRRDLTTSQQLHEDELGSLRAERDALQTTLEGRSRDIQQLQHELTRGQATLEARTQEIQELQTAIADSTRQVEELRQTVRDLEREREGNAQRARRSTETVRELSREREATARAQEERAALRETLASTEHFLETARRDLAGSQELVGSLKTSLDEAQTRTALLQEQVRSQGQDLSRLDTRVRALWAILAEIAGIVGGPPDLAGGGVEVSQEALQSGQLLQAVRRQAEMAVQAREEIAALRTLIESVGEVLGTTDGLPDRVRRIVAERGLLAHRLQQIVLQMKKLREDQMESAHREQQLREEHTGLSARVTTLTQALEAQRLQTERLQRALANERQHHKAPERPEVARQARMPEAGPAQPSGEKELHADTLPDLDASPKAGQPETQPSRDGLSAGPPPVRVPTGSRDRPAITLVECTAQGLGGETPLVLRAQISGINEIGMVGALEKGIPAGRVLTVRLVKGDDAFLLPGSVVWVQPSAVAPGAPPTYDHLIRFDHPKLESAQRLKAFLP